jgi:hypothetical protein
MFARKMILALATLTSLGTAALVPTSASAWGQLGRSLGWTPGRSLGPLGWLGLGPPLGRMGVGRMGMARSILRLAPVRRSLPASVLWRRLCGSNRRPRADQRILRPAAARSGLPRQRIYARWQRSVHRPLHPGRRGCKLRASARRPTPGWSAASTLKRPDACTISWSLAQTASRPRRQPRRTVSLAGAVSIAKVVAVPRP